MKSETFENTLQTHQALRFRFVVIELDLAITFSDLALNTRMDDRLCQNFRFAKEAYRTAIRFLMADTLTPSRRQTICDRLEQLRPRFQELSRLMDEKVKSQ